MEQETEYVFCYGCNNVIKYDEMVKHCKHNSIFDECTQDGKLINKILSFNY